MTKFWEEVIKTMPEHVYWEPVAEPLYGWRLWTRQNEIELHPIAVTKDVWSEPKPFYTSRCELYRKSGWTHGWTEHEAPGANCSCGFWAFRNEELVWAHVGPHQVFGLVQAWGKIVECTFGFRAQYMRPVHLVLPDFNSIYMERIPQRLSERYNVPVYSRRDPEWKTIPS